MQSPIRHDLHAVTQGGEFAAENELSILRDVFRMLPTGVTVQDEQGRFLLVNDAAAAQLGLADGQSSALASQPLPKNASPAARASRSFSRPIVRSASRTAIS